MEIAIYKKVGFFFKIAIFTIFSKKKGGKFKKVVEIAISYEDRYFHYLFEPPTESYERREIQKEIAGLVSVFVRIYMCTAGRSVCRYVRVALLCMFQKKAVKLLG